LLPAFIFDDKANICDEFSSHIEAGANVLVAPTYLYNSQSAKKKAIDETVKASRKKFLLRVQYVKIQKKQSFLMEEYLMTPIIT